MTGSTPWPSAPGTVRAADLMRPVHPLRPGDGLDRAMEQFVEDDLLALPVADGDGRVVGMVRRSDVAGTYLRLVHAPPSPSSAAMPKPRP